MNRKYTEKILKRIRNDYYRRMDAKDDEGRWVTTEKGNHIHFNDEGAIDKGNPHVVAAMSKSGKAKTAPSIKGTFGASTMGKKSPKMASLDTNRMTDTVKTKSGKDYPKLEGGAKYTKSLDIAEHTALEDEEKGWIPKGTWDKVVSNLKPEDIVYQTNEKGERFASIPGLASKVDSEIKGSERMKAVFDKAVSDEKAITKDLFGITGSSGMYLDGVENASKGASHLEDKAERKLESFRKKKGNPDATVDDVAESLGDLVRYTAMCDNKDIVPKTKSLIDGLEKGGYKVVELENKFLNDDGTQNNDAVYRAVHLAVQSPNGRTFELQIHSPQSQATKDLNHKEYNIQRDFDKTPKSEWTQEMIDENERLNQIQIERWHKNYENPPGIESLKPFKK